MIEAWQQFLSTSTASDTLCIEQDCVLAFADPKTELCAIQKHNIICDLSHFGVVKVSGTDAEKFLQGQLSCHLKEITAEESRLGAYCNPKGRIIANFRVTKHEDNYYLHLPRELTTSLIQHLKKYAIFSKVKLTDVSDHEIRFGVAGATVDQCLQTQLPSLSHTENKVEHHKGITLIHLPGPQTRYQVCGESQLMQTLWQSLTQAKSPLQAIPVGEHAWRQLNIESGIATISAASSEKFTPHDVNLQLINAVSFDKGCFVGQEVITRMHYRAKLKKHAYRIQLATDTPPPPGTPIFADTEQKRVIGNIINSSHYINTRDETLQCQAFALLNDNSVDNDSLVIEGIGKVTFSLLPLPYEIL